MGNPLFVSVSADMNLKYLSVSVITIHKDYLSTYTFKRNTFLKLENSNRIPKNLYSKPSKWELRPNKNRQTAEEEERNEKDGIRTRQGFGELKR